jgi:phosphoribosylamine-glycine ligase
MRFNIISETGDGMGFGVRLLEEGHQVRMWIRTKDACSVGDGLVPKVGDMEDLWLDADKLNDIFIFDTSGNGVVADYLRGLGHSVLGGSILADRLERDRAFGYEAMAAAGIKTPKSHSFTSFEDAQAFIRKRKERFVYKPSKLLGDLSCSKVTSDNEELGELLENTKNEVELAEPEFELQEFTPGVAFSTEAWFDGNTFLDPLFNHTFERKELMDGNLGPSGGCTGNIVWPCGDCDLCKHGIRKMEGFLREHNYRGMLDLNAIVTEDGGIYGLEWTPRFGYDASPTILFENLDGELGRFFSDVARNQYGGSSPTFREEFGAALRITTPPWPTEKHLAAENVPIRGLTEKDMKNVYLYNVKKKDGKLTTAGAWDILLLLTHRGASIRTAFGRPYDVAERVRVSDKQYRTDLVKQFTDDFSALEGLM